MTETSDEGTTLCAQCEAYARRIGQLAAKVKKLEAVARAADRLIYREANIYRPDSKKGLLKAALDVWKEHDN